MTKKELKEEINYLKRQIEAVYSFLEVEATVKKEVETERIYCSYPLSMMYTEKDFIKNTLVLVKKSKK